MALSYLATIEAKAQLIGVLPWRCKYSFVRENGRGAKKSPDLPPKVKDGLRLAPSVLMYQ